MATRRHAALMALVRRLHRILRRSDPRCGPRNDGNVSLLITRQILTRRRRSALAITDTDDRLIAAAAKIGETRMLKDG